MLLTSPEKAVSLGASWLNPGRESPWHPHVFDKPLILEVPCLSLLVLIPWLVQIRGYEPFEYGSTVKNDNLNMAELSFFYPLVLLYLFIELGVKNEVKAR